MFQGLPGEDNFALKPAKKLQLDAGDALHTGCVLTSLHIDFLEGVVQDLAIRDVVGTHVIVLVVIGGQESSVVGSNDELCFAGQHMNVVAA
jgi:hypothetical protein